jgi:hypothetical protein
VHPHPTATDPASTVSPNTSATQISPLRCGSSSMPDIQNANIDRGETVARIRTSTEPYRGVKPRNGGCTSRTTRPSVNGCCPVTHAVCTQDTRSGSGCTSGHHSGWSGGIVRRSSPSRTSQLAADTARELHCGRS